jgi:nitrile hydratase accessory protein
LRPAELPRAVAGALPHDDLGPVFSAPWQARAFAIVVALAKDGRFGWPEFQSRLIARIGQGDGDPAHYYEHWLAAAEDLLAAKDMIARTDRA